jgi:DNA polymerase-3 subunit alpha
MPYLEKRITHSSGDLSEAADKQKVIAGGMISKFRSLRTKDGKMMGFATLDDLQGSVELVIFTKTWARCAEQLAVDKVFLVEGRVDSASGEPKILADKLTPVELEDSAFTTPIPRPETKEELTASAREIKNTPPKHQPAHKIEDQPAPDLTVEFMEDPFTADEPSIPEPEFDNWPAEPADMNELPAPVVKKSPVPSIAVEKPDKPAQTAAPEIRIKPPVTVVETESPRPVELAVESRAGIPMAPIFISPAILRPEPETQSTEGPRMITITLRSSGDIQKDVRKMRCIQGTLVSFPGTDRFAFQIFEEGVSCNLEFPNDSTEICKELIDRLSHLVGLDNLHITPIKIQ